MKLTVCVRAKAESCDRVSLPLRRFDFSWRRLEHVRDKMRSLPQHLFHSSIQDTLPIVVTMEKIKAALHIHDKTEVPGDGAVGNMQNPGSVESGPTSEELWGAGNADTKHHHSHKGDTVAAAAAAESSRVGRTNKQIAQFFASLTNNKRFTRTTLARPKHPLEMTLTTHSLPLV